jgi:hypothetical protein
MITEEESSSMMRPSRYPLTPSPDTKKERERERELVRQVAIPLSTSLI